MGGKIKHGMIKTPTYRAWEQMIQRCHNILNVRYGDYGGRGIRVCDRWRHSFKNFLNDMGIAPEKTSIDRINNDGDYSTENCRWSTSKQQNRNRRDNRLIEFNGETHCVNEWAEILDIKSRTLLNRLDAGWSVEDSFTRPVRHLRKE